MKRKLSLRALLYLSLAVFVLIFSFFLIPSEGKYSYFYLVGILGLLFLILGIVIWIYSKKEKGKLKTYLLITGISAIFPLISVILHNMFYALSIVVNSLDWLFRFLEGTFFAIALLIAPLTFLFGLVMSLIEEKKK
jgi:hypothetical protein